MTKERLNKFFGWLRTVEINESLKTDYSNRLIYLKSSEKEQLINDACKFVIDSINNESKLRGELSDLKNSNNELIHEIASVRLSLAKAIKTIKENK